MVDMPSEMWPSNWSHLLISHALHYCRNSTGTEWCGFSNMSSFQIKLLPSEEQGQNLKNLKFSYYFTFFMTIFLVKIQIKIRFFIELQFKIVIHAMSTTTGVEQALSFKNTRWLQITLLHLRWVVSCAISNYNAHVEQAKESYKSHSGTWSKVSWGEQIVLSLLKTQSLVEGFITDNTLRIIEILHDVMTQQSLHLLMFPLQC